MKHDTFFLWIPLSCLNTWCPTVQIILTARRCLIYAESELSALNRPCSFFSYHPTQHPPVLQKFSMFLSSAPKCDDNSHEPNTKTKTAAACSKMRAFPLVPNFFFFVGFSYSDFDKIAWQCGAVAQWHDSGCCESCRLWPCHTISSVLPWWLGQRWTWGAEVTLSGWRSVCDTSVALGHSFDQRSRWLSLNITVFLRTNGISRLRCEEQRLVVGDTEERKSATPLGLQNVVCHSGRRHKNVMTDMNWRTITGWSSWGWGVSSFSKKMWQVENTKNTCLNTKAAESDTINTCKKFFKICGC